LPSFTLFDDTQRRRFMADWFRRSARLTSDYVGSYWAFLLAVGVVAVWALTGPAFRFSDTWQLVINTSTTIVTFLMVFLIQYTQNRDSVVVQLKLDELLRAVDAARTGMVDLEHLNDKQLARLKREFEVLSQEHCADVATVADPVAEAAQQNASAAQAAADPNARQKAS
jgi:low affinity Fe/Cu permease